MGCKTVDVCGVPFSLVEWEPNGRDDDYLGTCDTKTGEISIDKTMPEPIKEQTLIHEWVHGVLKSYGQEHSENLTNVIANELYRKGFRVEVVESPK